MKHTTERTVEITEISSITCDVCKTEHDDLLEMQEFVHLQRTGGYGSVFGDGCLI